jgi:hypothetical protein
VLTALTGGATPSPAGSWWYTVHEPAAADGAGEEAASAGALPPPMAHSAKAKTSHPALVLGRQDRIIALEP